mmetsp:Transcript_114596/g.228063  ORF Transcript_114596/g.228063 Transcript_114596/m.228063 type:complete len:125 (+) Transcript_114596:437-811(+)
MLCSPSGSHGGKDAKVLGKEHVVPNKVESLSNRVLESHQLHAPCPGDVMHHGCLDGKLRQCLNLSNKANLIASLDGKSNQILCMLSNPKSIATVRGPQCLSFGAWRRQNASGRLAACADRSIMR